MRMTMIGVDTIVIITPVDKLRRLVLTIYMDLNELVTTGGVYQIRIGSFYYIGQTATLAYRLGSHYNDLRKGTHQSVALQHAYDSHKEVEFSILQQIADKSAIILRNAETFWIKYQAETGKHLLNKDPTGRFICKQVAGTLNAY